MMSVVGERVNDTLMDDLPNLKIEIENDLDQKMDTDEEASSGGKTGNVSSETEEGEVSDDDEEVNNLSLGKPNQAAILNAQTAVPTGRSILQYDTKEYVELQNQNAVKNPNGAFVTGVNVFSPEEQAKLDKRALRFGIEAVEGKVLTEKLLKKLYKSMGVKPTDKDIRLEALHMRGTKGLATQDVFSYFKDYGPASLEWITDNSCNVVWLDEVSAARALLGLSVHISGQTAPARAASRRGSAETDSDVDMDQPSVPAGNDTPAADNDNLSEESDAVTTEELGVDLPPGRWRRGAPHSFSPCILLRFATVSDKPVPKTNFGSHQFGAGYVGLISESRKRRMQQALPNPILFDDVGDEIIPKPSADDTDSVNPWGALAKTWGRFDKVRKPRPPSPVIERLLPMPTRMTPPPSPPVFSSQRAKLVPRTRHRREREAAHRQEAERVQSGEEESSDTEEWSRRSKMPRMRMHADDEEKKIEKRLKRRHQDRSLSVSPTRGADLRRKLKPSVEQVEVKVESESSSSSSSSASEEGESGEAEPEEGEDEVPDLRVAVPAETSPDREKKPVVRSTLFTTGNITSVLRGARGYSENDEDDEESDHSDKVRSSRRHRSRSKERRKHHRKHKKESSHHKSRRKVEDSDSEEEGGKIKSTIRRRSPERNRRSPESRERRSPRRERRRKEDDHKRSETSRRSDKRHGESKSSKDLRSKIANRSKGYDLDNEFRSKSPLQIELDNDYYKGSESD